jgi:hypothetical protein
MRIIIYKAIVKYKICLNKPEKNFFLFIMKENLSKKNN